MILKKGAQVKIISGKDKGKTGEILEINRKLNKVKIKGKYTSEAIGGRLVSDINNVNYENEIIDVFK